MENSKHQKIKLSRTSAMHYCKFVFRSCLFLAALIFYVINRMRGRNFSLEDVEEKAIILNIIWLVFVIEMVLRFFPSKMESMGCQKQFASNYRPTGKAEPKLQAWQRTFAVAVVWFALNGIIFAFYLVNIIDQGILLLISLAYSVCDMICILFFCPFQTWLMKNKCCTACRIYNWDYAMMFTPLIFIPGVYTWSLAGISLLLLAAWEIMLHRHPERFSERTNSSLSCANCTEKLCHHKKQLRQFLKDNRQNLQLKGNVVMGIEKKKN